MGGISCFFLRRRRLAGSRAGLGPWKRREHDLKLPVAAHPCSAALQCITYIARGSLHRNLHRLHGWCCPIMRFLAPLALGLAAAATTNPVLFVHVGKTCGGSAVGYLRRAVNVTEVHLRPVKREEVERASHIIVSVRDPTERVVSAFEWHRPGGDRTYGRCFHRKRDVERYGNSCADDELYKCAATADAFADLVASRNTTDRCARVAKAFLAPDAGARLLGEPLHFARLCVEINR